MDRLKLFSVEKAELALPLVKRIVAEIVEAFTKREGARRKGRSALNARSSTGRTRSGAAFANWRTSGWS